MADKELICVICTEEHKKPIHCTAVLICKHPNRLGQMICYSHCSGRKTGKRCKHFIEDERGFECNYEK